MPHCQPSGPWNAKILIVGEAPGETEERIGLPFVGESGKELDRMLRDAGISRNECFLTNVCRVRPPNNDIEAFIPEKKKDIKAHHVLLHDRRVEPVVLEGYKLLLSEINRVQPNVIIAFGNTPLWALTKKTGITDWRGSLLTTEINGRTYKIIPAFHPAYILRVWSARAITVHDLRRVRRESLFPERREKPYNFLTRPNYLQTYSWLKGILLQLHQGPLYLSVDIETRLRKHIACIGLAASDDVAICIPFMCVERPEGYWTVNQELSIVQLLSWILAHPNARLIGQNFSYDQQYIAKSWGINTFVTHDTMDAQHVLYPGTPKDLGYLSSFHCEDHVYWKDEGKEWNLETGEDQQWEYNCKDACRTFEIAMSQDALIDSAGLRSQFEFQTRLHNKVFRMMLRGVKYDKAATPALGAELDRLMQDRLDKVAYVCGHPLNPSSPKQMQAFFYTDMNEKPVMNRKTKRPSLDDDAMQTIRNRNPLLRPIVNWILDYRSFRVFKSTFVEAPPSSDGRMRSTFNISGTYTFRLSSSTDAFGEGANLQNLPGEETKSVAKAKQRGSQDDYPDIRKLYLPDEGFIFWNADLDRADLQVVVWEADDNELRQLLREGLDIHVENAKVLFNLQMASQVNKGMRAFAKAFVHGTNYGGSAKTMAAAAGVTVHQADVAQKRWFAAHPGIKEWQERVRMDLMTKKMVKNILGYRWVVFDRPDSAFNEALAWGPQSAVSCVINRGLVALEDAVTPDQCQVLLQVHDSLAGICRPDFDLSIIKKHLEIELPYSTPLTIPVSIETSPISWGACK